MGRGSPESRIAIPQRGEVTFDRQSFGLRTQQFAFHGIPVRWMGWRSQFVRCTLSETTDPAQRFAKTRVFFDPMSDSKWMRLALNLARRGQGLVEPNPMVGAVVVRDGEKIAEGWHHRFGEAHAEANALVQAGAAA